MQTIDIDLLVIRRILILHLTVVVRCEIGLRHILVHQTVQVIGHGLRELNLFHPLFANDLNLVIVSILVHYSNLGLHRRRHARQSA